MENLERNNIKGFTVGQDNQMDKLKRELHIAAMRIQELTQCPVCLGTLDSFHVMCKNGHATCSSCKKKLRQTECPLCRSKFVVSMNSTLNQVMECVPKPCAFADKGCTAIIMISKDHENICEFRSISCRINPCSWKGSLQELVDHVQSKHISGYIEIPENTCESDCTLRILNTLIPFSYGQYSLCSFRGNLFWKYAFRNNATKEIAHKFYYILTGKPIPKYYFVVTFKNGFLEFTTTCKGSTDPPDEGLGVGLNNSGFYIPDSELYRFLCPNTSDHYGYKLRIVDVGLDDEEIENLKPMKKKRLMSVGTIKKAIELLQDIS